MATTTRTKSAAKNTKKRVKIKDLSTAGSKAGAKVRGGKPDAQLGVLKPPGWVNPYDGKVWN